MSHLLPFVLSLAGFAMLALAMEGPQRAVVGRPLPGAATRALRAAGAAALLLALGVLVAWRGWGLGLVMFSGHTSLTAGIVHCTLILHARGYGRSPKPR